MVFQLIYRSRFVGGEQGSLTTVRDIIDVSHHNNRRSGITGFLIFDKTRFLQILEGDVNDVIATYERICRDVRHDSLTVITRREVDTRAFEDWAMGGYIRSPDSKEIFAKHRLDEGLDRADLDADEVVALALDLLEFEEDRRIRRGLSSSI